MAEGTENNLNTGTPQPVPTPVNTEMTPPIEEPTFNIPKFPIARS